MSNPSACDEVLVALRQVMRATDLYSKQLSKHSGLTAPQLMVMRGIRELGEVTIGAVAQRVSLSQATVTTIMDRLEKRGFITRVRSNNDKRKVHAYLTDTGKALLAEAPTPLQESFIKRFQALEMWEQHMLVASLQRVATMMNAEAIDAAPLLHSGSIHQQP